MLRIVRKPSKNIFINFSTSKKNELLFKFAAKGDINNLKQLISSGIEDVNIQDTNDNTPLHLASGHGHTDIVELLLQYKADPDVQNEYLYTPLHIASIWNNTEIVELLLKYNANPNIQNKYDEIPLHLASYEGHTEIIELLKKRGAKE